MPYKQLTIKKKKKTPRTPLNKPKLKRRSSQFNITPNPQRSGKSYYKIRKGMKMFRKLEDLVDDCIREHSMVKKADAERLWEFATKKPWSKKFTKYKMRSFIHLVNGKRPVTRHARRYLKDMLKKHNITDATAEMMFKKKTRPKTDSADPSAKDESAEASESQAESADASERQVEAMPAEVPVGEPAPEVEQPGPFGLEAEAPGGGGERPGAGGEPAPLGPAGPLQALLTVVDEPAFEDDSEDYMSFDTDCDEPPADPFLGKESEFEDDDAFSDSFPFAESDSDEMMEEETGEEPLIDKQVPGGGEPFIPKITISAPVRDPQPVEGIDRASGSDAAEPLSVKEKEPEEVASESGEAGLLDKSDPGEGVGEEEMPGGNEARPDKEEVEESKELEEIEAPGYSAYLWNLVFGKPEPREEACPCREIWSSDLQLPWQGAFALCEHAGRILVCAGGRILVLDAATGRLQADASLNKRVCSMFPAARGQETHIMKVTPNGEVYQSGEFICALQAGGIVAAHGLGEFVVVADCGGAFACFRLRGRPELVWSHRAEPAFSSPPWVHASSDGVFCMYGAETCKINYEGEKLWTHRSQLYLTDACLDQRFVYLSSGERISRRTGEAEAFASVGVWCTCLADAGREVLFATCSPKGEKLIAVSKTSSKARNVTALPAKPNRILVSGGRVFAVARSLGAYELE